MKGWALTISGAFFGFSVKDVDWRIAAAGLVPLLVFCGLDAYFLSRERMYRALYDAVRRRRPIEAFSMDYLPFKQTSNGWLASLTSGTVAWFYAPLVVVGLLLVLVAALSR
jgi:hypothetical protein